jgi:phage terminase small subunit
MDWNAARAARKAGYSEKTAQAIGLENLGKPLIKQYIEQIKANLEESANISRNMVIAEHMKLAFSSIAHLHNTWVSLKEFEALTDDQKASIADIQTRIRRVKFDDIDEGMLVTVEEVKIKLYDKQKSLDAIAKMMGYNAAEKVDHTTKGEKVEAGKTIIFERYTDKPGA